MAAGTPVKFRDWGGTIKCAEVIQYVHNTAGEFYVVKIGSASRWVNAENVWEAAR